MVCNWLLVRNWVCWFWLRLVGKLSVFWMVYWFIRVVNGMVVFVIVFDFL